MDIYTVNLTALLAVCGALFFTQRKSLKQTPKSSSQTSAPQPSSLPFLSVYALVLTSDWLQGPFLYPLYHDEHSLPPSLISTLFTTGFLSSAVAGSFIGRLADTYGRKKACLAFCAIYALSCVCTTAPSVPVLVLGRVLGGVGTSLLFSVFEGWMVSDFKAKGGGEGLGVVFGRMSTVNSVSCGERFSFWSTVVFLMTGGDRENEPTVDQDTRGTSSEWEITADLPYRWLRF